MSTGPDACRAVVVGAGPYVARVQLRYAYRLAPTGGQRKRWRRRSGARGWCSTTRSPRGGPRTRRVSRTRPTPPCRALPPPADSAASVAGRGVRRGAATGVSRRDTAYRDSLAALSGKRKGRTLGAPRFRSRRTGPSRSGSPWPPASGHRRGSAAAARDRRRARPLVAAPARRAVERDGEPGRGGPLSRLVRRRCHPTSLSRPPVGEVGIDLGLTHFAVPSDGTGSTRPRIARKRAAELRRAQKELARRQIGSANRRKSRPQARPLPRPRGRHPSGLGYTRCLPSWFARTN